MNSRPHTMNSRQSLRLVSFDGGGMRSLSQLDILDAIMTEIRWELYPHDPDRPMLPCEHFTMIGGSDTGGLIAILLVVFQMSVKEASSEFAAIVKTVYEPVLEAAERTKRLKKHMKKLFREKRVSIDLKMEDAGRGRRCAGFATAALKLETRTNVCFRTYRRRGRPPSGITVLDAVLATCASQPDFLSASFKDGEIVREYVGAGIAEMNPIRHVMTEAQALFGGNATVSSIISVGSGHPGVITISAAGGQSNLDEATVNLMRDAEQSAQGIETQIGPGGPYFRFSVAQGMHRNEAILGDKLSWYSTQTQVYLERNMEKVARCASTMITVATDAVPTLDELVRYNGLTVLPGPYNTMGPLTTSVALTGTTRTAPHPSRRATNL